MYSVNSSSITTKANTTQNTTNMLNEHSLPRRRTHLSTRTLIEVMGSKVSRYCLSVRFVAGYASSSTIVRLAMVAHLACRNEQ